MTHLSLLFARYFPFTFSESSKLPDAPLDTSDLFFGIINWTREWLSFILSRVLCFYLLIY